MKIGLTEGDRDWY